MWVAEFSNMDETHVLPKYQAVKQVQLKHGHQIIDFESVYPRPELLEVFGVECRGGEPVTESGPWAR
jgi:hypothetical protein